jgi:hypothetical protein
MSRLARRVKYCARLPRRSRAAMRKKAPMRWPSSCRRRRSSACRYADVAVQGEGEMVEKSRDDVEMPLPSTMSPDGLGLCHPKRALGVLAQTGLSFDLSTASGKLMRTIMHPGPREIRPRGCEGSWRGSRPSSWSAALRQEGQARASHAPRGAQLSPNRRNLGLSKNTVMEIVKRGS